MCRNSSPSVRRSVVVGVELGHRQRREVEVEVEVELEADQRVDVEGMAQNGLGVTSLAITRLPGPNSDISRSVPVGKHSQTAPHVPRSGLADARIEHSRTVPIRVAFRSIGIDKWILTTSN